MAEDSVAGSINGTTATTQNRGYQNDALNPYFLHSNENPGNVLVTPLLSSSNYHSWSRAMTVALRSKNKLHFINGSLPRPLDEDRDSIAWDRCNTMVMSWLSNAVEPEISQSILWIDTASEIWKELKDRFYQGDVFRISDIQEEIYTLKQGDSTISTYYTKMKKLWQELDNFRPIPNSNCTANCQAITKMREYRDGDQVIRFLKGLNEQYSHVRSQIMLMEPLPNIGKVYSLLAQQERQQVIPLDESKILAASASQQANRAQFPRGRGGRTSGGRGRGKNSKYCTYCGMTNHIVEDCYKKHGYPPHLQQNGTVNNCANFNEDDSKSMAYDEEAGDHGSGKLLFTPDQHKALLALLQNSGALQSHSDTHSMRMIGVAEMSYGLYTLTTPSVTISRILSDHCITKYTWVYFMKLKSEASQLVKKFVHMAHTQFNAKIKCIRSDNGPEFKLETFYNEHGIVHHCSCVATPQQNGIVERKHQHILSTARALLFQADLSKTFWAHAVSHATHIINRLPTPFLSQKSPFQILHNALPDIASLKVFGCLCFATTLQHNRKKLDSRSKKCVYLGSKLGVKGHILFDLKSKELFLSRDVVFFEHIFPYKTSNEKSNDCVPTSQTHIQSYFDELIHPLDLDSSPNITSNDHPSTPHQVSDTANITPDPTTPNTSPFSPSPVISSHDTTTTIESSPTIPHIINKPPLRKSTRITHPPGYLQDFHCNLLANTIQSSSADTSNSSTSKYPLSSFISYQHLSPTHQHYTLNLSSLSEPTSYEKAISDENWKGAIKTELNALMKNNTWNLVPLPSHKKAIGCKWVFKLKLHADGTVERHEARLLHADGTIERHKARLVAKGFTQTEGLDYMDTFSPVVKMTTVRVLMAIAASQNWSLFQLDVNTAFLHGDLNEEVYMQPPPGLELPQPNLVCKLQRSLYGLKQASRQWNTKLTETLTSSGYIQSKADYSLFTKQTSTGFTVILVYVDDLVLGGTDMSEIHNIKTLLDDKFSIKDLGNLKYFLGFEVARSKEGISLCQRKYALDLIEDDGLLGAKPCPTPMQPQLQLQQVFWRSYI
ncbi:hypothetical protein TSUD_268860 [Trifolium subterraneum]|uniref:Integrase catalytic domain-containing protein n=1 Tax=Trifolium subterraneum TaxID=3900 RepID=A0A2Z6NG25_TRISU|nr:hypothetical protein TSUD_268860 [Trifolium subterraneum]